MAFRELDEKVKEREAKKLIFLPYLVGINAPEFDGDACGVFFGLRAETDAVDMARSVMEGVALLLDKNLAEMRQGGLEFSYIVSTGGAAKSDVWSQIKADICGMELRIPANSEAACFGAAMIGSVCSGAFPDYDSAVKSCVTMAKNFFPGDESVYRAKKAGFAALYRGMLETAKAMREAGSFR
jgi:xylulokinase